MKKNILTHTFLILLVLLNFQIKKVEGQSPIATVPLEASRYKINRLAPGQPTDEARVLIDNSASISIQILSNIGTIQVSVVTPGGQIITPQNVETFGGTFRQIDGVPTTSDDSIIIIPQVSRNFHYIYDLPSQGNGEYVIKYQAPLMLNQEVPIITEVKWDSDIVAKLFIPEFNAVVGKPININGAIFMGTTPVVGAAVEVSIRTPDGNRSTISLLDNGNGRSDDKSGDGLYGGQFVPSLPGKYSFVGTFSSTKSSKRAFIRNSLTELTVKTPASQFTGTISNRGVDDNSDGLFDRIEFRLGTQTQIPGLYQTFVEVKTNSGKILIGNGTVNLTQGLGEIVANIPASAVIDANENGPYSIEIIRLEQITETAGSQEVDRRINLGQTQPYQTNQFQRPPLILTGVFSEQGIDTNGNGKFDILRVSVQVDVLTAGLYEWNMKLANSDFQDVSFASARGNLAVGLNNITVDFRGTQIRRSESNGPYEIRDLLLFGPQSIVGVEVGGTRPYLFTDFEEGGPNVSISLSPATANLRIGQMHTVNVMVMQNTSPVASRIVTLQILSGPNAGLVTSKTTNASGTATFTYTGNAEGTDNIRANVTVDDFLFNSNLATATWVNNAPPICSIANASTGLITPPDNRLVPINIMGLTDPDGDPLSVSVNGVMQDEPTNHLASSPNTPDATIQNGLVSVKAERILGTVTVNGVSYVGNGRVYHIFFTANDGRGGTCSGKVVVGVPHVRTATPVDDGAIFNSLTP